jgi:cytoskeletal protein RodZ
MSNDENKQEEEDPELSNSQESITSFPSKASIEKDGELTTKEPAEERKVVVVKPSEARYKENNSSTGEQNKEGEGEGEQSVTAAKAKEAGQSFIETIKSLGKKAMTKAEEKTKELKDKSIEATDIGTHTNARDIQALGIHADNVVLVYERIMFEIEREDYETQKNLLTGYKKLLEEQVNVIDSKLSLVKRLKDISK